MYQRRDFLLQPMWRSTKNFRRRGKHTEDTLRDNITIKVHVIFSQRLHRAYLEVPWADFENSSTTLKRTTARVERIASCGGKAQRFAPKSKSSAGQTKENHWIFFVFLSATFFLIFYFDNSQSKTRVKPLTMAATSPWLFLQTLNFDLPTAWHTHQKPSRSTAWQNVVEILSLSFSKKISPHNALVSW